ncbi:MAG: hypothetical protein IPM35_00300 [Myxococcales bacterium]|nr:hypothetical protein [Myxococcales bacterium]
MRVGFAGLLLLGAAFFACSSDDDAEKQPSGGWSPGKIFTTPREPSARGFVDRRGLIHAHSVHSHDACDGQPKDDAGAVNAPCLKDFRAGLCASRHDFVMLTDHNDSFGSTEYPESLLFDASQGDVLVERDGAPVANRLACPDGNPPLVLAGTESGFMPVGIERHVAPTTAERGAVYGAETAEAIAKLKEVGAVVLVQHTEDWTVEQLGELPLDGFEMFNLHANTIIGAGAAIGLIADLKEPELLPYPDLVLLPIVSEDKRYLERWGTVLASGKKRVTTMGTDCHQNTFKDILPDGERIDSYRRMMGWFSNHLLVKPDAGGSYADLELKEALRSGRLYGAFEVLGFPEGFDFHAKTGAGVTEMGDEVALGDAPELVAKLPKVKELDPSVKRPDFVVRLLRAKSGGWDVVKETAEELAHVPSEPGAYRVEVRMKPRHLLPHLSSYADLAEKDFVWIYSNAVYVK